MEKDIRQAIIWHDEAVALGSVEPLDHSGDFKNFSRRVVERLWAYCTHIHEIR